MEKDRKGKKKLELTSFRKSFFIPMKRTMCCRPFTVETDLDFSIMSEINDLGTFTDDSPKEMIEGGKPVLHL